MPDIVISEAVGPDVVADVLRAYRVHLDSTLWQRREELYSLLGDARAILVRNMTPIDRELLAAAPRLEVVGRIGVGMDTLDVAAINERGVVICYPSEENAVSVAEHVFALLLALARKIVVADRAVREGRWPREECTGVELYGKTMGVLGLGRIGFRVATRARAFGMRVLGYDPYLRQHSPAVTEASAILLELDDVLRNSDFISIHLPLTAETRGLINRRRLRMLKPTALLINTARGAIVDEAALVAALRDGRLAGAALDVREQEPPPSSPLHEMANVVLTPHIASWTREAQERVVRTVAEDVDRVLRGEAARCYYNFPRPRRPAA